MTKQTRFSIQIEKCGWGRGWLVVQYRRLHGRQVLHHVQTLAEAQNEAQAEVEAARWAA